MFGILNIICYTLILQYASKFWLICVLGLEALILANLHIGSLIHSFPMFCIIVQALLLISVISHIECFSHINISPIGQRIIFIYVDVPLNLVFSNKYSFNNL